MKINNKDFTLEDIKAVMEEVKNNPSILEEKKSRFFSPKNLETFWYITTDGEACYETSTFGDIDETLGVYRTESEAILARDRQQALVRLWNNADERYYFRPDWNDTQQEKYSLYYDFVGGMFRTFTCWNHKCIHDFPYFKSFDDCNSFISKNISDLYLYCLGVKK
jgi:hypothetical protein